MYERVVRSARSPDRPDPRMTSHCNAPSGLWTFGLAHPDVLCHTRRRDQTPVGRIPGPSEFRTTPITGRHVWTHRSGVRCSKSLEVRSPKDRLKSPGWGERPTHRYLVAQKWPTTGYRDPAEFRFPPGVDGGRRALQTTCDRRAISVSRTRRTGPHEGPPILGPQSKIKALI